MTGVTEWLEPLEIEFELTRDGRCYFADSQPLVIELLDYWSLKYWIFRHLVVFARQLGNMMCYWLCVFKCMNVPYIWYDDIHDFTNTKLMRRRNASWTRLETWRIMLVQPKGIGGSFCLCPDWCLWLSHVIVLIVWNHGSHINNMFFTRLPDAKFHHWPRNCNRVAQQLARGLSKLLFSCMTRGHHDPTVGNVIGWVDSNI